MTKSDGRGVGDEQSSLGADVLHGVEEIAAYINETPRRTYHMIQLGDIPAFRVRGRLRALKSRIREHYFKLAQEAEVHAGHVREKADQK